jgi:hypothetical protein
MNKYSEFSSKAIAIQARVLTQVNRLLHAEVDDQIVNAAGGLLTGSIQSACSGGGGTPLLTGDIPAPSESTEKAKLCNCLGIMLE